MVVIMKMIADQVVSRVSTLAAARGPKAVCEPWPPKAPARSAERPCCRRTTPMRNRAADRKSTRLNSSHANNSYAVFRLKKKVENAEQKKSPDRQEYAYPQKRRDMHR